MGFKNLNTFRRKLKLCRFFVFDFDGVFTNGTKGASFNERDSMGANMLRYGLWTKTGRMPLYAIASGESNQNAIAFAQREHFDYVFLSVVDKSLILGFITDELSIKPEEIVMVGDDINDTPLLREAGLKLVVNQPSSKHFHQWLEDQKMCDYLTRAYGGRGAVREICEQSLVSLGIFEQVIKSRIQFDKTYQKYWQERNAIKAKFLKQKSNKLAKTDGC